MTITRTLHEEVHGCYDCPATCYTEDGYVCSVVYLRGIELSNFKDPHYSMDKAMRSRKDNFPEWCPLEEEPKLTGMSCPFCCEAVYIYSSGKKVCDCTEGYGGMSR